MSIFDKRVAFKPFEYPITQMANKVMRENKKLALEALNADLDENDISEMELNSAVLSDMDKTDYRQSIANYETSIQNFQDAMSLVQTDYVSLISNDEIAEMLNDEKNEKTFRQSLIDSVPTGKKILVASLTSNELIEVFQKMLARQNSFNKDAITRNTDNQTERQNAENKRLNNQLTNLQKQNDSLAKRINESNKVLTLRASKAVIVAKIAEVKTKIK